MEVLLRLLASVKDPDTTRTGTNKKRRKRLCPPEIYYFIIRTETLIWR